jgi:glyoxylase-like metal-dependent hydrolase (beta-lactamase superfamily II)
VQAVLAKAKELVPGKPITQAIVTHHHFDHTAGLRAAVAEGLTIVTQKTNEAWFREMVQRKHTLAPDALAKSPKPLKILTFDDSYAIKDATMEMQLLHMVGATHGDGMLAVYFPQEQVYAEPDVWNPGAQIQPHLRALYADIMRRGLKIDRIVPMHGNAIQPYSEFAKVLEEWGVAAFR